MRADPRYQSISREIRSHYPRGFYNSDSGRSLIRRLWETRSELTDTGHYTAESLMAAIRNINKKGGRFNTGYRFSDSDGAILAYADLHQLVTDRLGDNNLEIIGIYILESYGIYDAVHIGLSVLLRGLAEEGSRLSDAIAATNSTTGEILAEKYGIHYLQPPKKGEK